MLDAAETVRWQNTSTASVELLVVVDSAWAAPNPGVGATNVGTFDLELTFTVPLAGDTCGSAVPLEAGSVPTQDLSGFTLDYVTHGARCVAGDGSDRAYQVEVPAGEQVTVVLVPAAQLDVTLSFADSAAACWTWLCRQHRRGRLGPA